MGNSTPQMTSAQLAIKEVEHYCENIKSIYDIAVNVCPFLPAAEKSLALDIGKVLLDKTEAKIFFFYNIQMVLRHFYV